MSLQLHVRHAVREVPRPREKLAVTFFRILVIDDDIDLSRLIEVSLEAAGDLLVSRAPNGVRGAQMAAADPPDLILLDLEMPVMDGLDTLRRIRATEHTACTPIVAVTGSHQLAPRCAEMIAACNAYLSKPFELSALHNVVRSLLSSRGEAA